MFIANRAAAYLLCKTGIFHEQTDFPAGVRRRRTDFGSFARPRLRAVHGNK